MRTIALIPCSKTKAATACPAYLMYRNSALFRGAWTVARLRKQTPFILSAKHGLLDPNTVIEPYDETLKGQPKQTKIDWASRVLTAIMTTWAPSQAQIVSYLGRDYADHLLPELRALGYEVEEPVKGLGQGQRLAWFKQHGPAA